MKPILIILILIQISLQSLGQGCGAVSETIDKKTGIKTKGGIISSKDFYSLLIHKTIDPNDLKDSLNYTLFLHAASKYMLSDSLINSKGVFELQLVSGKKIKIKNAESSNNPLGLGASIGFNVKTSEAVLKQLLNDPIVSIKVFEILKTDFSTKKQKKQQKILNCLINN